VVVNPGFNLFAEVGSFALALFTSLLEMMPHVRRDMKTYIRAFPTAATRRPIQEILLQTIAHSRPKLRARTAQRTAERVTRISIIALRVAPHKRLALLISARAMSARTLEPTPAALSIRRRSITRARRRIARTLLLRIAISSTGTTYRRRGSQLTVATALLIAVVTYGIILELACRWIAARIVTTGARAAAIAFFAWFHDAVPALLARDECDVLVVAEAGGADAVAADGGADVAD
jgi:hypothetical protein